MNFDDLKVLLVSAGGLGSWLVAMDGILKVAISLLSLFYIGYKLKQLMEKKGKK